jgi:hypothetical protein
MDTSKVILSGPGQQTGKPGIRADKWQILKVSIRSSTEASNVRDVAEDMLLLDENRTVLYTLTNASKRKKNATAPRLSGSRSRT